MAAWPGRAGPGLGHPGRTGCRLVLAAFTLGLVAVELALVLALVPALLALALDCSPRWFTFAIVDVVGVNCDHVSQSTTYFF
eukprot:13928731-Heterocapsa_arctica.AAC.1